MHKNRIFLLLLFALGSVTLFYSFRAVVDLVYYVQLTQTAQTESIEWDVEQKGRSDYRLLAKFEFLYGGELVEGSALLPHRSYRNQTAAAKAAQEMGAEPREIWFSARRPQMSALGHAFPVKSTVYASILWAITLYFLVLGSYVSRSLPTEE